MKYLDKIDKEALLELCEEFDRSRFFSEDDYEGDTLYRFYLKKIREKEVEKAMMKTDRYITVEGV